MRYATFALFLLAAVPASRAADLPAWEPQARIGPLPFEAAALTFADLDGSGTRQLVIAGGDRLRGVRLDGDKAEVLWEEKLPGLPEIKTLGAADADGDGKDELFLNVLPLPDRHPEGWVVRRASALKVAQKVGWVLRVIEEGGSRKVFAQRIGEHPEQPYSRVFPFLWSKGRFAPGDDSDPRFEDDWLFGVTVLGSSGTVTVQRDENLSLRTPAVKVVTEKDYAGTPRRGRVPGEFCQFYPPLFFKPDPLTLWVFKNIPGGGMLSAKLGQYKSSEAYELKLASGTLNESALRKLEGYTADAALTPDGQFLVAVVTPDKKTYLYRFKPGS